MSVTCTPIVWKPMEIGTLPPVAVALAESVIRVGESIDRIRVPAGMPAPETNMPTRSPAVVGRVTVAEPWPVEPLAVICGLP